MCEWRRFQTHRCAVCLSFHPFSPVIPARSRRPLCPPPHQTHLNLQCNPSITIPPNHTLTLCSEVGAVDAPTRCHMIVVLTVSSFILVATETEFSYSLLACLDDFNRSHHFTVILSINGGIFLNTFFIHYSVFLGQRATLHTKICIQVKKEVV